jgi:amino acid adenylation domain-containing protein
MKLLLTMNLPYMRSHGGANRSNRALVERLAARGHKIRVIGPALATPSPITFEQYLAGLEAQDIPFVFRDGIVTFELEGVEVHAVEKATQLRAYLVTQMRAYSPDWMIVSSEEPSQNLLDAALQTCPGRVIYLAHTPQLFPFGPYSLYPGLRIELIKQARAVLTISHFVADYVRRWAGLEAFVFHPPHYGEGPFPMLGRFEGGNVVLLNAGDIKGLPIFLALARAFPKVSFAAVPGYATTSENLADLARLPNVTVRGNARHLDDLLRDTHVLLMPSLWIEGFGMATVDAMLRGIPVLASNAGGLVEAKLGTDYVIPVKVIEHFEERLDDNQLPHPVVPEQDIEPWRAALEGLVSDRALYERQAAAARAAATAFVSSLRMDPFEEWLTRLDVRSPAPVATPAPAEPAPVDELSARMAKLSPDRRALLIARLGKVGTGARPSAAIARRSADGPVPLSSAQARLFFLEQFEPNKATYNVPLSYRIAAPLDERALSRALDEIVRRHEVLRTTYLSASEVPVQVVHPPRHVPLPITDLCGSTESEKISAMRQETAIPFNLERDAPFRAHLFVLDTERHILVLTTHHIASDAWSLDLLQRELGTLYDDFRRGEASSLKPLTIQYADYAVAQQAWLESAEYQGQLTYWRGMLSSAPALDLPTDRPRPALLSFRGASEGISLSSPALDAALQRLKRDAITPFMAVFAAFTALLSRYSGQQDVVLATTIANRDRPETQPLIGFFNNTLVLCARVDANSTAQAHLQRSRALLLDSYAHQDMPFDRLVATLQPTRDPSRNPLFQVMLQMGDAADDAPATSTTRKKAIEGFAIPDGGLGVSRFDLLISINHGKDDLCAFIEYSTDLFDRETIVRMAAHLKRLLEGITTSPATTIAHLPLLGDEERQAILVERNDTARVFDGSQRIHEIIEAQARRTPEATAVEFEGQSLSYEELDRRSNQLARRLRKLHVGRDVPVGVCLERSLGLVVSLLAVLKAGGAYLPLDPTYPRDRLEFMISESGAPVLLTERGLATTIGAGTHTSIIIDAPDEVAAVGREETGALDRHGGAKDAVYIIYTSGSTGRPKGVINVHEGLANRLKWMQSAYALGPGDRVLQKTSFGFDVSVWEFFWPLMYGACLVVARPGGHRDAAYLVDTIVEKRITVMHFVPPMLQVFLEEPGVERCTTLRDVICSGEALPYETQQRFFQLLGSRLHNLYGPTEASIDVTYHECQRHSGERVVPIGRPIANTQIYILDAELEPTPVGVAGELYIGGIGVARGYLRRPALTAERFVPNPFGPGRLYRTGDLARLRRDGAIEYLGRIDHQVKVRGFRIELGEIESVLASSSEVRGAVVVARADATGDKRLVAYVVPSTVDLVALKTVLREKLPEYMLPAVFVPLDELPLNANGKVDRKALPAPELSVTVSEYVAPRTEAEKALAELWCTVLSRDRVGVHDNFFALGGHSLLAMRLVAAIRSSMSVKVPVRDIFERPTIAELAASLSGPSSARSETQPPPVLANNAVDAAGVTSFAQDVILAFERDRAPSGVWTAGSRHGLHGPLDKEALRAAISARLERIDNLLSTFELAAGTVRARTCSAQNVPFELVDMRGADDDTVTRYCNEQTNAAFRMDGSPLIRFFLIGRSSTHHELLVTWHQLVNDPSAGDLIATGAVEDYAAIRRGAGVEPVPALRFRDFAASEREWVRGDGWRKVEAARAMIMGASPLDIADKPRRGRVSPGCHQEMFALGVPESARFLKTCEAAGVTAYMAFCTVAALTLARRSGEDDICFLSPVNLRDQREESGGVVGRFANWVPMRFSLAKHISIRDALAHVRSVVLDSYSRMWAPATLVYETDDIFDHPLNRVLLNTPIIGGRKAPPRNIGDLTITSEPVMFRSGARNDVAFIFYLIEDRISAGLRCASDLFEADTVREWAAEVRECMANLEPDAPQTRWSRG